MRKRKELSAMPSGARLPVPERAARSRIGPTGSARGWMCLRQQSLGEGDVVFEDAFPYTTVSNNQIDYWVSQGLYASTFPTNATLRIK